MNAPVIAFFTNKAGVGKTSLVYHLAWMYSDLGVNVLAADLDPQANLTAAFGDEETLEMLWSDQSHDYTIYRSILPLVRGTGDVERPNPVPTSGGPALLAGDLALSNFEDELSSEWPSALDRKERAFRVLSAFWRVLQLASQDWNSQLILMDLGPNLGAINRAALIAADYVVIPLSPDLFSLRGLENLGPTFRRWRNEWKDRLARRPSTEIELPEGNIQPLGYVVQQHSVRLDRPVKAYERWINRIPGDYRRFVLEESSPPPVRLQDDPHKLALLKHYRSLMPMAQEARKPMFHLKPADGAIGAHFQSVQEARKDFEALAQAIAGKANLTLAPVAKS